MADPNDQIKRKHLTQYLSELILVTDQRKQEILSNSAASRVHKLLDYKHI